MLLFLFAETGCKLNVGGRSNPGDPPDQTRILKTYAIPSTVAPGDTAKFVCVIADSTNARFRFIWFVPNGTALSGEHILYPYNPAYKTVKSILLWKAPSKPDLYDFAVTVDDSAKDSVSVEGGFQVIVK